MKIIGCGIVSLPLIYLGAAPVFNSLAYLYAFFIKQENENSLHILTQVYFVMLCMTFSGFGWIYSCLVNRKTNRNQVDSQLIQTRFSFTSLTLNNKYEKLLTILLYFIISVMIFAQNIIQTYMAFYFKINQEKIMSNLKYELFVLDIFYLSVLSYFILHYSLYRHQLVSLVLISIGMLLILFPNIVYEENLQVRLPLYALEYLLSDFRSVIEKYLMETMFISIYQILFFEGLIGNFLCIIFGSILEGIPLWKKRLGSLYFIFNECFTGLSEKPGNIVLAFVFTMIYNICAMLIKYYYTPMHCSVTNLLSSLIMWIFIIYKGKFINTNYAQVAIGYVFIIFGLLLYIEIIICYVWDLHLNTKIEIELRGQTEEDYELSRSNIQNTQEGCFLTLNSLELE